MTWAQKQRFIPFHFKSADQRRIEAVLGYSALGQLATPSLSDTLTNDPFPCARRAAASALGLIGPKAKLAAPALFRATKDTDDSVRIFACGALGRIQPDPRLTIPVLVAGLNARFPLTRCSAATALGEYGPEARPAVPALLRMLATNGVPGIEYVTAVSALKKIDPEAAVKAGVKW
jgi:HEAT repeat protein